MPESCPTHPIPAQTVRHRSRRHFGQERGPWPPGSTEIRTAKIPGACQPIHHSPDEQQSRRISQLEGKDYVAVIDLVPVELCLECGFQQANHLSVDVVDCSCEKQQTADDPTAVPRRRNLRGWLEGNVRDTDLVNRIGHKPFRLP